MVALFRTYTERELNEFIGRVIAERLLLTLSLEGTPDNVGAINAALNALSRVQEAAGEELRKREALAAAMGPYVCEACGRTCASLSEVSHSPAMCNECWEEFGKDWTPDMNEYVESERFEHFIDQELERMRKEERAS
jgi:hypothetical protein